MSKLKKATFDPNKSPVGWYIASIVERFEFHDEDRSKLNRRCLAYENMVLIGADNPDEAYGKAIALGKLTDGNEGWTEGGRKGAWRFEGLSSLLPVYENLADGAEIRWMRHDGRRVSTVKKMVKRKAQLEAFQRDST